VTKTFSHSDFREHDAQRDNASPADPEVRKRMDDIPTVSVPKFNRAARQAARLLCSAKEMVPVVRWIKAPAAIPACRRRCGLVRHLRAYATWLLGLAKDAGLTVPPGQLSTVS
jgi:hypothetical protein